MNHEIVMDETTPQEPWVQLEQLLEGDDLENASEYLQQLPVLICRAATVR